MSIGDVFCEAGVDVALTYFFILSQNIIHSSGAVQDEMAHYLYVLQSVTLNLLEPRMRTPLDCSRQVSHESSSTPLNLN